MRIIVIEDDGIKRDEITRFLNEVKIEFKNFEYINHALRYIRANKDNISGIILDLGLASMPGAHDTTPYRGLDVLKEMKRLKLDIPVLINSTTELEMISCEYPNVFGHRNEIDDYESLENFIFFLRHREEQ